MTIDYNVIFRMPESIAEIKDKIRRKEEFEAWKSYTTQELVNDPNSEFYAYRPENVQEAVTQGELFLKDSLSVNGMRMGEDYAEDKFTAALLTEVYCYWVGVVSYLIDEHN